MKLIGRLYQDTKKVTTLCWYISEDVKGFRSKKFHSEEEAIEWAKQNGFEKLCFGAATDISQAVACCSL